MEAVNPTSASPEGKSGNGMDPRRTPGGTQNISLSVAEAYPFPAAPTAASVHHIHTASGGGSTDG